MDNYIETRNKTQLMRAVMACPNDSRTLIVCKRKDGGQSTLKIGPTRPEYADTPYAFDKHLRSIVRNIKRTPTHVWR